MFALKNKLQRALFDQQVREVLNTKPVALAPLSPLHLLSQVQHKDVRMYLVATKSFLARVPAGRITVLDDGSLTPDDKGLLSTQVLGVSIRPITNFRSPRCPVGGCWERLLAIAAFSADGYVIQLDTDTVTLDDLEEVRNAIADDASFCIGTWDDQRLEPMLERARDAAQLNAPEITHVQVLAEKAFDRIAGAAELRYARGCAGFAGFAKGSARLDFIEDFAAQMTVLIGSKWSDWGSEQVMSNVVVANSTRAAVLPHPEYCDCEHITPQTKFVHFIGSCRFTGGAYARMSRQALKDLQQVGA
jgi:hypothetical protein